MSTNIESNSWRQSSFFCGDGLTNFAPLPMDEEVEAILSQGMKDLTFDELQKEQEDLHGVIGNLESSTDAVNQLLQSLKEHLARIQPGTALEQAESRNPAYVHRRDFQIMFLRANRNDPKAAAEQMIRYFALKQKLFGKDKMVVDITAQDLEPQDLQIILTGHMQLGSVPDRSGRSITWALPSLRTTTVPTRNILRGQLYMTMKLLESMEDTSKGITIVSYQVGEFREQTNIDFGEYIEAALATPFNIAGYHFCFDSRSAAFLAKTAVAVMPAHLRVKTRIHYGSHQECQYLLSGYGIPREAIPLDINHKVDLTFHNFWVHECMQREQLRNSSHQAGTANNSKKKGGNKNIDFLSSIWKGETPTENDVLCVGRKVNGKGNERLMNLALLHSEAYDHGTPIERRIILNTIMEEIKNHGGRFLKLDTTKEKGWVKVEDLEMREKICQTFRNLRYRRVSQQSKAAVTKSSMSSDESTNGGSTPTIVVTSYRPADVLFGKLKDHQGNVRLRKMVHGMAAQYDTASRGQKKELSDQIMDQIRASGGRFLKPLDDARWEVVSDKVAAKKIGHHFRNLRRKQWR